MSGEETTENTEQPTTSAPTPSEDATPKTDDPHHPQHHHHQQQQQQPEKRGEDADRYAASVAEVAAGGGGGKKDGAPGVPGASAPAPGAPPAPSPAPGPPTGPPGPPMHHQVPPNSFAPPPGMMEWRGEHQMPPGYYPPYGMPPRHHPGYPPPPPHAYYGPQGAYGYPPPHMMRPPVMAPGEMVRMPPGPTPTEWAAQQQAARAPAPAQTAKEQGPNGNPATPSSVSQPCPSPSASSIAEESMDGKPPGTKMPQEQGPPQHQMMSPMPPHTPGGPPPPQTSNSASATPVTPADVPKVSGKVLSKAELLDKLVGPVTHHNPIHVMHERRVFFERLIEFCERNGDPITMVPQVSKQSIDLHRLYIGVRGKGGFQAVTKEKYWKNLCTEANPDLAESSAAGYQLRKHYQRHLLMLECMETGRNPEDEVAFADKMKRQRKREPAAGSGAAAAAAVAAAAAAQQEKPTAPASAPGAAAPPAAYPGNGQGPPGAPQPPPGAPPPGAFPPHMDPNYHYYQQHGMMPPHPGYHPQHMNAFSPGAQYPGHQRPPGPPGAPGAPPAVPPGAQPMRAPMPQHMQQHEMDEQQRQWYAQQHAHQQALAAHHHAQQQAAAAAAAQAQAQAAQAPPTPAAPQAPAPSTTPAPVQAPAPAPTSGANTQPATPSASNQPPTPAATATLQVESTSQAGSRAPSTGPAPSATPDSTSRLSAGADAPSETPTPTGEAGSSTPAAIPSSTTPAPPAAPEAPSTSAAPTPSGPPGPPQGAPPQGYPYPYPPPPGAMRPPTGFAPPPGAPYGYPPGAPPPPGAYHPSHPQHPQHAQYMAWQQQRYHQQQQAAAAAAAQGQGPPGGPRGPYPGYPGGPPPPGAMPPQRMPPGAPQGAPSPVPPGGPPGGKGAPRYGTPAAPPQNRPGGPQAPQPLAATLPLPPQPSTSAQPPSAPTPGGYLASTLATPGAPPQAPPPQQQMAGPQQQQQHQYPQGSVEAITTAQCHVKRRKVYARELINATPRRLVMALRSGLDAEAIWSINALNVLLYDDTNPQPSLQQMPGLLNVIVEHLYATLSILFPEEFPLAEPGKPVILEESKELVEKLIGHGKDQNGSIRTMIERMPVVPRKGSDKTATFTMQSRNGLQVHFRDESLPAALRKRITREHTDKEPVVDQSITSAYVRERNAVGLGGGIAERLAVRLRDKILHEKTRPRPVFSKYLTDDDEEDEQKSKEEDEVQVKLEPVDSEEQELQTRGARPEELSDCKHEVELAWPRPTALSPKSHAMEELAHRALSLSNILRGFSFVPGSDALMARNEALLFILGRFLKLNVTERKISTKRPGVVLDADELKKEPQELSAEEKRAKERAVLDNVDATRTQMVETSGQLRDDAFVMLTHMSVSLNLFELPDTIAYPIYDGLLSWAVSRVPEATDATAPIPVSPRDYSLEIMCKMVVIERNVDMFLSTGKWSRVEQFVHILSRLLTMNEETHYREFAIVILNALCIASEAVCYICAMETSSIAHLILFIDSADQNMHQVMQAHGMNALRDNPELMGTSVGMLRRAASMLRLLVKVPKAYRIFLKHQTRLLQFTMSQLMDSRVAGMVADTLFEIQEYVKEFGEEVPEPLKITYSEVSCRLSTGRRRSSSEGWCRESEAAATAGRGEQQKQQPSVDFIGIAERQWIGGR